MHLYYVYSQLLEAAEVVMIENNLHMPQSVEQALNFYLELLSIVLGACNCHLSHIYYSLNMYCT